MCWLCSSRIVFQIFITITCFMFGWFVKVECHYWKVVVYERPISKQFSVMCEWTTKQLKRKKEGNQGINLKFWVSGPFHWNSTKLFNWKALMQTHREGSEFPYDDRLPVLTAHDLVDVEGVGLHLDASLQPQSAMNQSSLLWLWLGHGLVQPGSSQTHWPHGGIIIIYIYIYIYI